MANLTPTDLRSVNIGLSEFLQDELAAKRAQAARAPAVVVIRNTAEPVVTPGNPSDSLSSNFWRWRISVGSVPSTRPLAKVVYHLHPTFTPSTVEMFPAVNPEENNDFALSRTGWGTFAVRVDLHFQDAATGVVSLEHELSFDAGGGESCHDLPSAPVPPTARIPTAPPAPKRCMEGVSEAAMHGRVGIGKGWLQPQIVHECDEVARPGSNNSSLAHEYQEMPSTLRAKVAVLAELLREARHCVAYTGAGISTASGIDDYASKGRNSLATGSAGAGAFRLKGRTGLNAQPTFSHYTLAALQAQNMVHSWVQQNHDGLPQKAGFPQHLINEIHGAWFDPSNPVVPMDGSLRSDLFARMLEDEQKADLVLTVGTSLCGMNADRVVRTAADNYCNRGRGLGSVIIGFQRTPLDDTCSLRIFARIDEVMLLLARELGLCMDLKPYQFSVAEEEPWVYHVPYDSDTGQRRSDGTLSTLDLRVGAKIQLTGGPGKGYIGHVKQVPTQTGGLSSTAAVSFCVQFPCTRENDPAQGKMSCLYALGGWMVEAAVRGELEKLPVVNVCEV